jgi:hypothetical protein
VRTVHHAIEEGHTEVVDADLSKYFDAIPHSPLTRCVARRVSDGKMLHLMKMWLKAPVEETDERASHLRLGAVLIREPDLVAESITGRLSRRMLEQYSHSRVSAKKAALNRLNERRKAT